MADWTLTPALVTLRATFNRVAPDRDKASDGSIGDAAHASSSSDHNPDETGTVPIRDADTVNEVHAIDVDEDLRAQDARGPFTMMRAVRQIVTDCRSGRENRLRYVIYERTIWSASWDWGAREYTGANPHDKHGHFSGSYNATLERDTSPWNIGWIEEEDDVALSEEDLRKIGRTVATWDYRNGEPVEEAYKVALRAADSATAALAEVRALGERLAQPVQVQVDAAAVAAALAGDADFLAAIARVVNDEAHRRSAE